MRVYGKSISSSAPDRAGRTGRAAEPSGGPVAGRLERLQRHRENIRRIYRELNADRSDATESIRVEKEAATAGVPLPSACGQKNQIPTPGRASPTGNSAEFPKSGDGRSWASATEKSQRSAEEDFPSPRSPEPSANDPVSQEILDALQHYEPPRLGVAAGEGDAQASVRPTSPLPPADLEQSLGMNSFLASCSPTSEQRSATTPALSATGEAPQITSPVPANDPADEMAPDAAGASTLGTDSLLPYQKLDAILNQWREKYAAFQRATQTVLSTDATVTNSKPARVGASREASESDDEAFLRKIKQEVGLDVGPIWDSLPTPGGSAGGSPIAAEADLYPLPVALEEDFRHLRAALAADAEPQVWQEGAEAETHDGDDDANTSGPHEAAAADERDKNAAQDEAAWIQPDRQTADAETGGGTAESEPKDQMLARLLALEAEVSRLREGAAPIASASPLSPEPSAESPRRPEERGGGVTERGEALLNSLAMSLLSSGSSLFASMSDGPTSPVWRQGTGAALSQQVEAEPVRDAIENRPPKEERFEEEADGLVQQSRTLETAVQVPEFSAVAAAVQTEAEDTAEDTAIAKSEEQPSTLAEPMLPSNRQGADEEGASAQAGLPLEYSTEDPRQPTEAKPGAALQGLPASVNPEAGSGPLPSRTLPADSAMRQAAASSAVPAARSRFELVAQLPADWPAGASHPSELPMLPPHLPKLLQTSPQRDATHAQAQSGWRPVRSMATPYPPSVGPVKASCASSAQGQHANYRAAAGLEDDLLLRRAYDVYRQQQLDLLHPEV